MKCYLQNACGTIRRVDKIKLIADSLPKDTDYSRRLLLCNQNKIPFRPYILTLKADAFEALQVEVGDAKVTSPIVEYRVFDSNNIVLLRIVKNG